MKNGKKWGIILLSLLIAFLFVIGGATVIVDPYFHYHAPLEGLEYPIYNERYQNDGILRHFEYDAIITGSSMTQNFKTTEMNALFDVNAIKVPFSGSSFKEINDNLITAFEANPNVKVVVRALDCDEFLKDKDSMRYDSYPEYLTDDIWYNDVQYIFNKKVFFEDTLNVLKYTANGNKTTTFDEYGNWMAYKKFGIEGVLSQYSRPSYTAEIYGMTDSAERRLRGNVEQNIVSLARQYPDTEFYYFLPPYSICYWDNMKQTGSMQLKIDAFKLATELMLEQDNIHVFSFFDDFDMITNLDNYKDISHYHEDINTQMLHLMKAGEHRLTWDNYQDHWDAVYAYYSQYDYDSLFE